jgi:hypothetical protein
MMSHSASTRTVAGQFRPGLSGNPAGRPKGARNKTSVLLERLREGEAATIARAVIELALAGDKRFLFFMAQQLFPKPRGCPVDLGLAEECEAEPRALLDAALRMTSRGEISPLEGLDIARLVEKRERAPRIDAPVSGRDRATAMPPAGNRSHGHEAGQGAALPANRAPAAAAMPPCRSPVSTDATRPMGRKELLASASPAALAA